MNFIKRYFNPPAPPLSDLWNAIVATGREPRWYTRHQVADDVNGRFDMIVVVTALVMLRLERENAIEATARLTERFVEDMDGSLRQIGIGDMVIGKHMGKVIGALGGRIDAYRKALEPGEDPTLLPAALTRNVYRGAAPEPGVPEDLADAVRLLAKEIDGVPLNALLEGRLR